MADYLNRIAQSPLFNNVILAAIILTTVLVGVETLPDFDASSHWGRTVLFLQEAILWLFLVEVIIKIGSHGARPWEYFYSPWNVFDFVIVAICFLPLQSNFVAIFRIARLLRTLRMITFLPQLQFLIGALLRSIPALGYVGVLLLLHFYMYAVMGTFLFRHNDPVQFGSLPKTMLTLFQVITLEAWPEYMRTQIYGSDAYYDPIQRQLAEGLVRRSEPSPIVAPLYFISFIFLGAMIVLNLFTGIIINGLEGARDEVAEAARKKDEAALGREFTVPDELALLSAELQEVAERMMLLKAGLQQPSSAVGQPAPVAAR
jgi:voltage-gated sodium channel